ncbi:hypothetical protein [Phocaeicola faecalis]
MKTFKLVQRIAAGAGLVIALKMVDNLQPSDNELLGGMMLVVMCAIVLIGDRIGQDHHDGNGGADFQTRPEA